MTHTKHRNHLVLVIDDEEAVREAVTDILEFEGLEVIAADDGQKGIELFNARQEEVDLILLDLSMPGMSGAETFQKLKKIKPTVQILLSSGFDEADIIRHFAGQEVTDFLQKPYNMRFLVKKVREYLD